MTRLAALVAAILLGYADPTFQSYRAHIAAADAALRSGDIRLARSWLEQAPQEHRGWEWHHLDAETDHSLVSFRASDSSVTKLQVSPDGSLLATASADGVVRLWDTGTYELRGELEGHTASVFGLSFSADGKRLVTTSRDNSIRLWDVAARSEIRKLGEHPVTPYSCAFTPDGKRAVSVGWRMHPEKKHPVGLIRVWDVESRTMLHTQDYTTHPISTLAFSPDGRTCYIGCWEYQILVMDMTSYQVTREIEPRKSQAYKAIDWIELDPRGGRLVTACKDKTAKVFDLATGDQTLEMAHRGHVTSARFSSNGEWLVTSSQDGALRLFRATDGSEAARLLGHGVPVNCAAVTPDGRKVFSGDTTGKILAWDVRRPMSFAPTYQVDGAWSCVFSPDGGRIATGTNQKVIQIRDAANLDVVVTTEPFGSLAVDVAWAPDGSRIAGGSNDGTFRVFDAKSGKELWKSQGKGQMRSADWSRDGRYVASGAGGSGVAYVWEAAGGKPVFEHSMTAGTLNVAFSPDSKWIAIGSAREIRILEVPSGALLRRIETPASDVLDVAVSPDGKTIAAGGTAGHVELFGAADGLKRWSAKSDGSQWGIAFSPDGSRLASTGYDFAIHLWDPVTGLEVFALRDLPIQGFDVRFSPDGQRLAYMGGSGQVWIIDRRPWRLRGDNHE